MEIQEEPLEIDEGKEQQKETISNLRESQLEAPTFAVAKQNTNSKAKHNFPVNALNRSTNESLLGRKSITEIKDKIWLDTINANKHREHLARHAADFTPR